MSGLKKLSVYLVLALLLAGFAGLLFYPLAEECVQVLQTGTGGTFWMQVDTGAAGEIAVLGVKDGILTVARGDSSGKRLSYTELDGAMLPKNLRTAVCYPDGETLYLGVYDLDEPALKLFCVTQDGVSLLLERPCSGTTVEEQVAGVRLSDFSRVDGLVSFVMLEQDTAVVYGTLEDGSGLVKKDTLLCRDGQAAYVLADGHVIAASGETVLFPDSGLTYRRDNQIVTDFKQVGAGVYTMDRAGLAVFYTDLASPDRFRSVTKLEKADYDLNGLRDLALTDDGGALLLLKDGRLLLEKGSAVQDLSGMLYRSRSGSALVLAGLGLGVLLAAFVLWLIVCQWRGMRLSLLVRWGFVLTAVTVLGVSGLLRFVVEPAVESSAAARAYGMTGSVTALTLDTAGGADAEFVSLLTQSMAAETTDTLAAVYEKDENSHWRLTASNTAAVSGTRAELTADFDRELALQAQELGAVNAASVRDGQQRFCRYEMFGSKLILISVGADRYLSAASDTLALTGSGLWLTASFLLALCLAVLVLVVVRTNRLVHGLERINDGETGVRVVSSGGDELESLGRCVNTLARTMEELEQQQQTLSMSYRRFVPERVLSLLGKQALTEVDKQTVSSAGMAVMMVWFRFPQPVYEKGGHALFDNLNEIIERTVPIIAANGGTVFNFAYDGFDAVFEGGAQQAVSTAVAVRQEILSINNERELDGKPCVDLRIALDEGTVLMGLVGDENQMEPIAVSSCFSVTKRLIGLCRKLDANILCTEAVAAAAQAYGSRYMGKCMEGGVPVRTYEIFDGDSYAVRRVKLQTAKEFADGVYLLYSLDFAGAKRVFLNLVHHNTGDGGAKYYLFLADELEKRQDPDINLDDQL